MKIALGTRFVYGEPSLTVTAVWRVIAIQHDGIVALPSDSDSSENATNLAATRATLLSFATQISQICYRRINMHAIGITVQQAQREIRKAQRCARAWALTRNPGWRVRAAQHAASARVLLALADWERAHA